MGNFLTALDHNAETLDLSEQELVRIPDEILRCRQLRSLRLTFNNIRQFPKDLDMLSHLQEIDIDLNQFEEFPADLLALSRLKKLDISLNFLQTVPPSISRMQMLRHLDLSHNDIDHIPNEIGLLFELKVLNLARNKLQAIPNGVKDLKRLVELDVSFNHLREIDHVGMLSELQRLNLAHNHIESLPESIPESLSKLQEIGLQSNSLSMLPDTIWMFSNIKTLNLSENQLTGIPTNIDLMRGLSSIDFSHNKICHLPKLTRQLYRVRRMSIAFNRIEKIEPDFLSNFPNIRHLNARHNSISDIGPDLGQLGALSFLDLSFNRLESFPTEAFHGLLALKELDLGWNRFQVIQPEFRYLNFAGNRIREGSELLKKLKDLEEVHLSYNQTALKLPNLDQLGQLREFSHAFMEPNITTIPDSVCQLHLLEELRLTSSCIQKIPPSISLLQRLHVLDLSCNQIDEVPSEIFELRELEELNLSSNRIMCALPSETPASSMLDVDLSRNRLTEIPEFMFEWLQSCRKLKLHYNRLQAIPVSAISKLEYLSYLSLEGNPIEPANYFQLQRISATRGRSISLPIAMPKIATALKEKIPSSNSSTQSSQAIKLANSRSDESARKESSENTAENSAATATESGSATTNDFIHKYHRGHHSLKYGDAQASFSSQQPHYLTYLAKNGMGRSIHEKKVGNGSSPALSKSISTSASKPPQPSSSPPSYLASPLRAPSGKSNDPSIHSMAVPIPTFSDYSPPISSKVARVLDQIDGEIKIQETISKSDRKHDSGGDDHSGRNGNRVEQTDNKKCSDNKNNNNNSNKNNHSSNNGKDENDDAGDSNSMKDDKKVLFVKSDVARPAHGLPSLGIKEAITSNQAEATVPSDKQNKSVKSKHNSNETTVHGNHPENTSHAHEVPCRFAIGWSEMNGRRPTQEDSLVIYDHIQVTQCRRFQSRAQLKAQQASSRKRGHNFGLFSVQQQKQLELQGLSSLLRAPAAYGYECCCVEGTNNSGYEDGSGRSLNAAIRGKSMKSVGGAKNNDGSELSDSSLTTQSSHLSNFTGTPQDIKFNTKVNANASAKNSSLLIDSTQNAAPTVATPSSVNEGTPVFLENPVESASVSGDSSELRKNKVPPNSYQKLEIGSSPSLAVGSGYQVGQGNGFRMNNDHQGNSNARGSENDDNDNDDDDDGVRDGAGVGAGTGGSSVGMGVFAVTAAGAGEMTDGNRRHSRAYHSATSLCQANKDDDEEIVHGSQTLHSHRRLIETPNLRNIMVPAGRHTLFEGQLFLLFDGHGDPIAAESASSTFAANFERSLIELDTILMASSEGTTTTTTTATTTATAATTIMSDPLNRSLYGTDAMGKVTSLSAAASSSRQSNSAKSPMLKSEQSPFQVSCDIKDVGEPDKAGNAKKAAEYSLFTYIENAMIMTYRLCHQQLEDNEVESGTTSLTCVIINGILFSANAGDARAVLSRKGTAYRISRDHKPNDPSETERIRKLGGFVAEDRTNGILAVSRSLGDTDSQPFVTYMPYFSGVKLIPDDQFFVMACDGVWDVLSDQEVVDEIHRFLDDINQRYVQEGGAEVSIDGPHLAAMCATRVRDCAYLAGSTDNISCIVVLF